VARAAAASGTRHEMPHRWSSALAQKVPPAPIRIANARAKWVSKLRKAAASRSTVGPSNALGTPRRSIVTTASDPSSR
jgi:hypothetical protein